MASEPSYRTAWENSAHFRLGLDLLNAGRYFEAHEVLEDVWRPLEGPARQFLQGLIQVAVALHHLQTGNLEGAQSVIARAATNLATFPDHYARLDLQALRAAVQIFHAALANGDIPAAAIQVRRLHGEC